MSLSDAAERIREQLHAEDAVRVSIALFGQPGCGKSSLINRLTGQKLALEGVRNDVTTERQDFEWNGLTLVDLPGYDTARFPAAEYLTRFGVLNSTCSCASSTASSTRRTRRCSTKWRGAARSACSCATSTIPSGRTAWR